ncbi:hypothetical protein ACROYT_G027970 [Oculina patagonica]
MAENKQLLGGLYVQDQYEVDGTPESFGRSQSYRVATTPLVDDGGKGKDGGKPAKKLSKSKARKKEKKENLEDLKKELEIDWHTITQDEVCKRLETNIETTKTRLQEIMVPRIQQKMSITWQRDYSYYDSLQACLIDGIGH